MNFEKLANFLQIEILSYLSIKDLFMSFCLSCHYFLNLLSENKSFENLIIKRIIGMSFNVNVDNMNLLIFIKKILKNNENIDFQLPFYGFYTNGGCDKNMNEYWIDTIFIKGNWYICSKKDKNVCIKGGLKKDFDKTRNCVDFLNKICEEIISFNPVDDNQDYYRKIVYDKQIKYCKKLIEKNNSKKEFKTKKIKKKSNKNISKFILSSSSFELNEDYDLDLEDLLNYDKKHEKICKNILNNFLSTISREKKQLLILNNDELIESNVVFEMNKISIIRSIEISRSGPFTCPIRTLAIFCSFNDIEISSNPIINTFNDVINIFELKKLIFDENKQIPKISFTNCEELKSFAENKSNLITSNNSVVIFDNKQKNELKLIAWIQFNSANSKIIKLKLKNKKFFGCRFIMLKLINSDNLIDDPNENPNIDINYVTFSGHIFNFQ